MTEFPQWRALRDGTGNCAAWRCCCCFAAARFTAALARTTPQAPAEVALADLPKEAQDVHALVGTGGPFRFDRDGVVFGNREKLLPAKPRGYYHEYTVRTPGAKNRGAPAARLRRPGERPRRVLLHR